MVVVTMIEDHDDDVHDDDDDDDVTDCEEVSLRGRTRTNAPSESLTAADWLKRALSARWWGWGRQWQWLWWGGGWHCSDNDFDDVDNDGFGHVEDEKAVKGNDDKETFKLKITIDIKLYKP